MPSGNVIQGQPLNTSPAPAAGGSSSMPAGASTFMSAAAPTFTPQEQQQNQWASAQGAQQQNEAMTQMFYQAPNNQDSSAFGGFSPTKALQIVDPRSGASVEAP